MSLPTSRVMANPSAPLPRVKRIEALSRRAEDLQFISDRDAQLEVAVSLVAEMAQEMFRMAHAMDGVM